MHCTLETRSWHATVRKWDRERKESEANYFELLGLEVTASKLELAQAGQYLSSSLGNTDNEESNGVRSRKDSTSLEFIAPTQLEHLEEVREFLVNKHNRDVYRRYAMYQKGLFSKERWQALRPRHCHAYILVITQTLLSLAFIGVGLFLCLAEGEDHRRHLIQKGILGGGLIGAGILSLLYMFTVEFVVEQHDQSKCPVTMGYVKKVVAGLLGGSASGAIGIIVGYAVIGHPEPEDAPLSWFVLEGCLTMMIDAFLYSLADGLVSGSYIYSCPGAVAVELTIALFAGSIAGALTGLVIHHLEVFDEVISAVLRPIWPRLSRLLIISCKCCLEHCCEKVIDCSCEMAREEMEEKGHRENDAEEQM